MTPPPRILKVGEELPPMDEPTPRPACNGRSGRRPKGPLGKATSDKRHTGDRFGTLNAFLDFTMAGLRPSERAVWLLLWRDTKKDGIARTSETDLARRAGCCVRMIRYALTALADRGLLRIVSRGRLRTGPSSYRVFGLADHLP